MNGFMELLFGSMPADYRWLMMLKEAADKEYFDFAEAEAAADKINKTDSEYKNALSRLAYFLAHIRQYNDALRLFEKDSASGRQTWWGKLRHAECIALSGDAATASAIVLETYSENTAAVNGFGHMGWSLLRAGKAERAEVIEIIKRDIELGRITNGFKLVAGRIIAPVQADMSEKLINEAYSADSSLKDGFSMAAAEFLLMKNYAAALIWFEKDDACGRMSPEQRLKYAELLARKGRTADAEKNTETAYSADSSLRDGYSRLFRFSSVFDTPRYAYLLAEDKRRGRSTGIYAEADSERLSENYGLLADIERAEKRFGMSVGLQYAALEKMVRENAGAGFTDVLGFRLKIASPFDVLVQFREIFLEENYYFTSEKEAPFIIDGGANAGMALAYFKWLYPSSVITAFEPNPELFEICKENIESNGWKGITLHPYALSDSEGTVQFTVYPAMPMGSGIAGRFSALESRTIDVQTVRLSRHMSEYTDFLKLDIEGAEEAVLKELGEKLSSSVASGFVEYHYNLNHSGNKLGAILGVLENNGFEHRLSGRNLPDNAIILRDRIYPEQWSGNIFFTKSWTSFMNSQHIIGHTERMTQSEDTGSGYLKTFISNRKLHAVYPKFVQIETTVLCNAECVFCPNEGIKRKNKVMQDDLFEKIISDLRDIPSSSPLSIFPLRTGEFLTDKKIFERIRMINSFIPHADICLFSNFNLADESTVRSLYEIKNLAFLHISLHSFDREEYKAETGLDLEQTLRSVCMLLEANKQKRLCREIRIIRVENGTNRDEEFLKHREYIKKISGSVSNVDLKLSRRMDWLGYLGADNSKETHLPCSRWLGINVDSDGNVPLCCLDWDSRHIFGNIREQSLLEIYNSPAYRFLRESVPDRTKTDLCRKCLHI